MAHHSSELEKQMLDMAKSMNLGATGLYPQGKIAEGDEGEIALAVGIHEGKVILNFGKPVAWMGLDYEQAMQLADSLKAKAFELRGITL